MRWWSGRGGGNYYCIAAFSFSLQHQVQLWTRAQLWNRNYWKMSRKKNRKLKTGWSKNLMCARCLGITWGSPRSDWRVSYAVIVNKLIWFTDHGSDFTDHIPNTLEFLPTTSFWYSFWPPFESILIWFTYKKVKWSSHWFLLHILVHGSSRSRLFWVNMLLVETIREAS